MGHWEIPPNILLRLPSLISTPIWLTEALLPENASEADWPAIAQIRADLSAQSLDDLEHSARKNTARSRVKMIGSWDFRPQNVTRLIKRPVATV